MYQIGEFSRIVEMPVKTLRFYHEQQLLVPAHVDPENGYRYYNDENLARARVIKQLRQLEFSLEDISTILRFDADEASFLERLQQQKRSASERSGSSVKHQQDIRSDNSF